MVAPPQATLRAAARVQGHASHDILNTRQGVRERSSATRPEGWQHLELFVVQLGVLRSLFCTPREAAAPQVGRPLALIVAPVGVAGVAAAPLEGWRGLAADATPPRGWSFGRLAGV
jgi:hypothetical protein